MNTARMQIVLSRGLLASLYLLPLTPLFFWRSLMFPLIVPRVFVFQAVAAVAFALWGALWLFFGLHRPRWTAVGAALALFIVALTLSSVLGEDLARSLWSAQERGIGLVALLHFAGIFIVLGSVESGFLDWRKFLGITAVSGFVVTMVAGIQITQPVWFLEAAAGRPGSFLGNPAFLAAYLLFHFYLLLWFAFERALHGRSRQALLIMLAAACELIIIFLTQTRGALVGLAAGSVMLLALLAARAPSEFRIGRIGLRRIAAGLLGVVFLAGASFWITREAAFWRQIPGLQRFASVSLVTRDLQPRLIALRIAWDAFVDRPVFGYGLENFKYPFDERYDPELLRYGFQETHFDKPHNAVAEYLVTGGMVGLAAYLALLASAVFVLLRTPALRRFSPFGVAMLVAYFVQNLFLFDAFGSYLMLFVVLGFVHAQASGEPAGAEAPKAPLAHIPAPARGFAWLVFAAIILVSAVGNATLLYASNREYWGVTYFVNREPDRAAGMFRAALAVPNPYAHRMRLEFGSSLAQVWSQGVPVERIAELSREAMNGLQVAIVDSPKDYFLHASYADLAAVFVRLNANYLEEGKHHARQALELSPSRQHIYVTLAKLEVLSGDLVAARDWTWKAVQLDPEVGEPHFHYGILSIQLGERDAGFAEIERAAALGRGPINFGEATALANAYGDAERYMESARYYEAALGFRPGDLESRLKLGIVYYYDGKYDLARREIGAVMEQADIEESAAADALRAIATELGL